MEIALDFLGYYKHFLCIFLFHIEKVIVNIINHRSHYYPWM